MKQYISYSLTYDLFSSNLETYLHSSMSKQFILAELKVPKNTRLCIFSKLFEMFARWKGRSGWSQRRGGKFLGPSGIQRAPSFRPTCFRPKNFVQSYQVRLGLDENRLDQNELDEKQVYRYPGYTIQQNKSILLILNLE